MVITFLVIAHPLLIKASENFTPYISEKNITPIYRHRHARCPAYSLFQGKRQIFLQAALRLEATLVLVLLPAHILFVSDTYKSGTPRHLAIIIFGLNLFMIIRIWLYRFIPYVRKGVRKKFVPAALQRRFSAIPFFEKYEMYPQEGE